MMFGRCSFFLGYLKLFILIWLVYSFFVTFDLVFHIFILFPSSATCCKSFFSFLPAYLIVLFSPDLFVIWSALYFLAVLAKIFYCISCICYLACIIKIFKILFQYCITIFKVFFTFVLIFIRSYLLSIILSILGARLWIHSTSHLKSFHSFP